MEFTHAKAVRRLHETVFTVAPSTTATAREGGHLVSLPSGSPFVLDSETDWDAVEAAQDITGRLYLYCGRFLTLLPPDSPDTWQRIESFYAWLMDDRHRGLSRSYGSWDHATAMRLESTWVLAARAPEGPGPALLACLLRDLRWASTPENVHLNNHGVFLLKGLLFSVPHLEPEFTEHRTDIEATVRDRLPAILDLVYADDGWCGENSPMYDRVWINLLRELQRGFAPELAGLGLERRLDEILEKADEVSRFLLLPNARYVPRGDSPRARTKLVPVNGTHFSTRVGVWTHHVNGLYLMATAGHASIVHKHVDDTQVYLHWDGNDFFLDGGFHSYNYADPRVPALRSQIGHSVLDVRDAEPMYPWVAYRKGRERVSGALTEPTEKSVVLSKEVDGHTFVRRLEVDHGLEDGPVLTYRDSGPPGLVARFLLANNAEVEVLPEAVVVRRLGSVLTLAFDTPIAAELIPAEGHAPHRGWYSTSAKELVAGQCLELRPAESGAGALSYRVLCGVDVAVPT